MMWSLTSIIAIAFFSFFALLVASMPLDTSNGEIEPRWSSEAQENARPTSKNIDGYDCPKRKKPSKSVFIEKEKIEESINDACERLEAPQFTRWAYPAQYLAASYALPGPYAEWPIEYRGPSTEKISDHRVVIDMNCNLVDVVTQFKDGHYAECKKALG
ncbi:hypothetical protein K3495_g5742 [Podosphaera aphanis]|nr:hypothetical protein K3495_g5742 [Podosphaera aphanis]